MLVEHANEKKKRKRTSFGLGSPLVEERRFSEGLLSCTSRLSFFKELRSASFCIFFFSLPRRTIFLFAI
jgi:hypothetical protein